MDPWQIIGIAVVIVSGLVGVIYWAGQSRDDKQDVRFERNEEAFHKLDEKVSAHAERIRALETQAANNKEEIGKLREMRHEIVEQCARSIADFYTDSIKRLGDIKDWVSERIHK